MELLIPGLILVALMVYVSTRIKKSAARAYEVETVDTPEFHIEKPDGMLNPLNDQSPYAFEAYSRDFGRDGNGNIRQLAADLCVIENASAAEVIETINASSGGSTAERNEGGAFIIETQQPPTRIYYKIIESRGGVYRF